MRRVFLSSLFVLMILSVALSACAAPAATQEGPTSTPVVVTQIVEGTPMVITATPEPQPTTLPAGSIQLNGAGATFPLPVYTEWIYAYQFVNPAVTINYQGIGSGGGKKAIIDGTVDFAGSDSLVTDDEYTQGKDLQMYPMLAGAVVPIYNIDGITADDPVMVLDGPTLTAIYNGDITNWNDPKIAALNPDLASKLPNASITVAHRSDGSGTTEIFTRALSAFDDNWKNNVGFGTSVEWPVDKAGTGIGGKGNAGVAATVQNTPNSIGYVELNYAIANSITFANFINAAGKTVTASGDTVQSAMNDFADSFTDKFTNVIVNGSGDNTWPIAGYTYLVLHTTSMTDCTKAKAIVDFFTWAMTDENAGNRASQLGYSTLPSAVRDQVLAKFGDLTCNGGQPVK